mmetsp:Transcript_23675/g.40418  ORF Transcript_23675/g.40418 Transcript_23675/m.40418 type:complete len:307 (+) Transcript_23675:257-1177(+)
MAAQHPRQNASSFRRISSPVGRDRHQRHSLTGSPPSLPLFSASSDHTSNSSNLSSKSGSNGPSLAASGMKSGDAARGKRHHNNSRRKLAQDVHNRALSKKALMENDAMVYLDGPQVYTCGNCRTHLTSHDDIISKSFHGRHGRAYLFDQCVNITTGPSEDRFLITGLHSVCDIFCKRCQTLVGWTYAKAYEPSQKYKEGKFIIEKMFLHLEESDYYDVDRPAGERGDKWRLRSMSWGSERSLSVGSYGEAMVGSPAGGSYYSRGGGSSAGGSFGTPTGRGSGAAMMAPKSPKCSKDIIYEYRHGDS